MNYLLITDDVGGTRIGLDRAGWEPIGAVLFRDDARRIYRECFPSDETWDVAELNGRRCTSADAVVVRAEISADPRTGQVYISGPRSSRSALLLTDVLIRSEPRLFVLEASEGSRRARSGFSFASMLTELTRLEYSVCWITLNACDYDSVQDRRRLLVVACRGMDTQTVDHAQAFWDSAVQSGGPASTCQVYSIDWRKIRWGDISETREQTRPQVGARRPIGSMFKPFGVAREGRFGTASYSVIRRKYRKSALGELLGVGQTGDRELVSVRFLSRNGVKALGFKPNSLVHSIGPGISGWPLVAAPMGEASSELFEREAGELFNWVQERDGHLVGRVTPQRSVRLFGSGLGGIENALSKVDGPLSGRYGLVSRLAVPTMIERIASEAAYLFGSIEIGKSTRERG